MTLVGYVVYGMVIWVAKCTICGAIVSTEATRILHEQYTHPETLLQYLELALDHVLFNQFWMCDTCGSQTENILGVDDPIDWDGEDCMFCQRGIYKVVRDENVMSMW